MRFQLFTTLLVVSVSAFQISCSVSGSISSGTTANTLTAPDLILGYSNQSLYVGDSVNLAATVSGTNASITISPALPAGLSLDSQTGLISGVPTVSSVSQTYTLTISNSAGSKAATFTMIIYPSYTVNRTADEADANVGDGVCFATVANGCTLRAALQEAQSGSFANNRVILSAGTYPLTSPLTFAADHGLLLTGTAGASVIDGQSTVSLLTIHTSSTVTIQNVDFKNGYSKTAGAAGIKFIGSLVSASMDNNLFGSLNLSNCNFTNNQTVVAGQVDATGAALSFDAKNLSVTNCNFTNNSTSIASANLGLNGGSAINIKTSAGSGTVTIQDSKFDTNTTSGNGIIGGGGGAIYADGHISGVYTFQNNSFTNNQSRSGGAIMIERPLGLTFKKNYFGNNQASLVGGGFYYTGINATFVFENNTFYSNTCTGGTGGAIKIGLSNSATFTNNTLAGNSATSGSDMDYYNDLSLLKLYNNIFASANACVNFNKGTVTSSYNIATDATCFLSGTGDLSNTNAQLQTGSLGLNSGTTFNIPILNSSPAYASATTNCPAADQRGVSRSKVGSCDRGAYEAP